MWQNFIALIFALTFVTSQIPISLVANADGSIGRYHCGPGWQQMYEANDALKWVKHCIERHGREVNSTEGMIYSGGRSYVTALHISTEKGAASAVRYLLSRGANINARNVYDRTPLHLAAIEGHGDICKILNRAGAAKHIQDVSGNTAYYYAARYSVLSDGHKICARTLAGR